VARSGGRGIDLVDARSAGLSRGNGRVEPSEQIGDSFAWSPAEHRERLFAVMGDGRTFYRRYGADHNLSTGIDHRLDVSQRSGTRIHGSRGDLRNARYAARRRSSGSVASTFHGSNWSMRLIGCSAMRSST